MRLLLAGISGVLFRRTFGLIMLSAFAVKALAATPSLGQEPSIVPPSDFYISHQSFVRANQNFFGADYNEGELSVFGLDYKYERVSQRTGNRVKADIGAFYSFTESTEYFNVKELFRTKAGNKTDITYGRKLKKWSSADSYWQLGMWQPQFRWDRMRPEDQGLTGLFFERRLSKTSNLDIFVSPLFVPDTTVQFDKGNGKFRSSNPWFKPPPDQSVIFDEDNEIFSYLETPDIADVVLNPSVAASYSEKLDEWNSFRISYGYKPINQILNSFTYKLRAAAADSGVRLTLFPWVAYHHLLTTEHNFEDRYWKTNLSATYEKPVRLFEDDDMVYQRIRDSYVMSWFSSYALAGEGESAFRVFGGYIRHFGGYEKDGGDVFDDGTQFEIRPRYLSTVRAGLSYPIFHKTRRIKNSIEINYDTMMNGGTVLSEVEYAFGDNLFVTGMLDIIGVFEVREDTLSSQYLNTFRANDKAQVRLSYVY